MQLSKTFNTILFCSAIVWLTSCTYDNALELVAADKNTPEQQAIYSMDLLNRFMYLVTEGVKRSIEDSLVLPFRCTVFSMDYQGNNENRVQFVFKDSCDELDGSTIAGILSFSISENLPGEYSVYNVTTSYFFINGIGINADMNFSYSTNNDTTFHPLGFELVIHLPDSSSITVGGTPDFVWLNSLDNDPSNDQFDFAGELSFDFGSSQHSTLDLSSPLSYIVTCQFPLSGIASCQPDSEAMQNLNLGNKTCDNRFSVTVNNYTKVEEIPQF